MLTRHCGDQCAVHTNIESLYCPSETNILLQVNFISVLETVLLSLLFVAECGYDC